MIRGALQPALQAIRTKAVAGKHPHIFPAIPEFSNAPPLSFPEYWVVKC